MTKKGLTPRRAQPGPRDPLPYSGSANSSAMTSTALGTASVSMPQSPFTIDLAAVTYWFSGPTMMTHGFTPTPCARAATACAPPKASRQSASATKAAAFVTSAGCGEATMTSAHQRHGHTSCHEHTTVQPSAQRSLLPRHSPSSGWSTSALRQRLEFSLLCESVQSVGPAQPLDDGLDVSKVDRVGVVVLHEQPRIGRDAYFQLSLLACEVRDPGQAFSLCCIATEAPGVLSSISSANCWSPRKR